MTKIREFHPFIKRKKCLFVHFDQIFRHPILGDEFQTLLKSKKSGIFNRLQLLLEYVVPDDDIKISLADLNMVHLLLDQFIVYEIYAHLPPGVGLTISDRLKKHSKSVIKVISIFTALVHS